VCVAARCYASVGYAVMRCVLSVCVAARCYASVGYAVMKCVLSVCASVCPSCSYILSKHNTSSQFFHHRAATPF